MKRNSAAHDYASCRCVTGRRQMTAEERDAFSTGRLMLSDDDVFLPDDLGIGDFRNRTASESTTATSYIPHLSMNGEYSTMLSCDGRTCLLARPLSFLSVIDDWHMVMR